jgi:hypothetical protein|tara:strand:+ start:300 stop:557 length:258 start_codon:yes stop_codon:yes gene_type:complete
MSKVHSLPKGIHIAPMPKRVEGDVGRKLQGGLPPEPYRNACSKWQRATKFAHDPFNSRSLKFEVFHTTSEWDKNAKRGKGAWVKA